MERTATGAGLDVPDLRISEIVLQTGQFDTLQRWYETVLQAKPAYEYTAPDADAVDSEDRVLNFQRLCFLRIQMDFPYSQVLALFQVAGLGKERKGAGLHHMQFRQGSLADLVARVEYLASHGIEPVRTFNHGPSTSFYFEDPDGNSVELSGPNVASHQEYTEFFKTPGYKKNPNGVPLDAKDFCTRFRAGDPTVTKLPG